VANLVNKLGDGTSHSVTPDFESGRGYYWMKQISAARAAEARGEPVHLPRKPRKTQAEIDFFGQVDRRLSRTGFTVNVQFDSDGKIIRE
jgi:hypothetical protein